MTAHAEQLGIHILDEHAEIEIEQQLGRILYCNITDDEIQIIHRSKYIKIGFSFLVSIFRIKILRIECP